MKTIKITGVPEHFNFPWLKLIEEQPLAAAGYTLEWKDESNGSGAMNKALKEEETDIAIILTESFIKDKIEGNPGKIIGYHVLSPLNWGIHVPAKSPVKTINDLQNAPFLISRYGSGSHLMTYLLAKKNDWNPETLQFDVVGNMDGALEAFADQQPKGFLWEKFTTKPLVDAGHFRRIAEFPTPWPCFVIVAHEKLLQDHSAILPELLSRLYAQSETLKASSQLPALLSKTYHLQETDILEWLKQTTWATKPEMEKATLEKTMDTLKELGLIDKKISVESLVASNMAHLI
ncbi:ABC transporter substrate-binding protein [Echinicola strongylocentroti]|uniref:ABC transporter substrate-binding protein n=1 Tax=Echinicola strongylocentroti TaxID=1795355 RepID=A0A2Z4IQB3_9BACT|nr:substrate-binding domain-containing protein [Echinicola strongylocentroti]AWW33272.1 ABC transporter substrate-binding protein [Echinicola strongylocentroti]